jgi:hypothetical protein
MERSMLFVRMLQTRSSLVVLLAAIIPSAARAQAPAITLLGYRAEVPSGWTSRAPSSTMRLAEYVLPATADASAEVVVFFFGPAQGGSVDANLARWRGQFSNPDGAPVTQVVTRD